MEKEKRRKRTLKNQPEQVAERRLGISSFVVRKIEKINGVRMIIYVAKTSEANIYGRKDLLIILSELSGRKLSIHEIKGDPEHLCIYDEEELERKLEQERQRREFGRVTLSSIPGG
jgi:hypothetical protein